MPGGIGPGREGTSRDGDASRAEANVAAAAAAAARRKKEQGSSKITSKDKDTPFSSSSGSIFVPDKNMISFTSAVRQTAVAAVGALANTDTAHALLTPLHGWLTSKRRVAEAIEAEKLAADAEKAERQRQLS